MANHPNLRFQGQLPFASIVDAIRQKPVLEEQIRASQGQQANQRFQSILQAAQQGIQLASFATQQSRQRQRQGQLEELGASLQQSLAPELRQAQQQLQQTQTATVQGQQVPVRATTPGTQRLQQQAQEQFEQVQTRQQQVGQLAGLGQIGAAQQLLQPTPTIGPEVSAQAQRAGIQISPTATPKQFEQAEAARKIELTQDDIKRGLKDTRKKINQQQIKTAEGLRKERTKLSGSFIQIRDSFGRIQESAKDPSAAGDLALIFNFMKMLDPGSVVRESEFATAQNAAGVPDRIRALFNRIQKGDKLAVKQREDFVDRATSLFNRTSRQQKKLNRTFTQLSKRIGVDPKQVVIDLSSVGTETPTESTDLGDGFSFRPIGTAP